jgi:hypothetical protein
MKMEYRDKDIKKQIGEMRLFRRRVHPLTEKQYPAWQIRIKTGSNALRRTQN